MAHLLPEDTTSVAQASSAVHELIPPSLQDSYSKFWLVDAADMDILYDKYEQGLLVKGRRPDVKRFQTRQREWLRDCFKYTFEIKDGKKRILKDGRLVICFQEWNEIISQMSASSHPISHIVQQLKAVYYTGSAHNSMTEIVISEAVAWWRIPQKDITKFDPTKFMLPSTSKEIASFSGTPQAVIDALSYLAHKYHFQIVRRGMFANHEEGILYHYFACARHRKHKGKPAAACELPDDTASQPGFQRTAQFVAAVHSRDFEHKRGASGRRCAFKVKIEEFLSPSSKTSKCIVHVQGIHTGHSPASESTAFRATHPALDEAMKYFMKSRSDPTEMLSMLQNYAQRYAALREQDFKDFEAGREMTRVRVTLTGGGAILPSPARPGRAYGGPLTLSAAVAEESVEALRKFVQRSCGEQIAAHCDWEQLANDLTPMSGGPTTNASASVTGVDTTDTVRRHDEDGEDDDDEEEEGEDNDDDDDDDDDCEEDGEDGSDDGDADSLGSTSCASDVDDGAKACSVDNAAAMPRKTPTKARIITAADLASIIRPTGTYTATQWQLFVEDVQAAIGKVSKSKRTRVAVDAASILSGIPAMFSNYNWDVTRDTLKNLRKGLRRCERGGRTSGDDVMAVLEEWVHAGWAQKHVELDAKGTVQTLTVFLQSPQQRELAKLKGVTDILQMDDTANITVWDMPMFAFMGCDPATMVELPLALGFQIHKKGHRYAKADGIAWLLRAWYKAGNPQIGVHMFDRDDSSFVALHKVYAQRFRDSWRALLSSEEGELLKSVAARTPTTQSNAAIAVLDQLQASPGAFPFPSPQPGWLAGSDASVAALSHWFTEPLLSQPMLHAGVLSYLYEACSALDEAADKQSKQHIIAWTDFETPASDIDSRLFPISAADTTLHKLLRSSLHVRGRVCMFHVKKSITGEVYTKLGARRMECWPQMYKDVDKLAYAPTEAAFKEAWEHIQTAWSAYGDVGAKAVEYLRKNWITDRLYKRLWPIYERNFARLGKNTTNGAESFFSQLKYEVFRGVRPVDLREAMRKVIGSPNSQDSQDRCYIRTLANRRDQISRGVVVQYTNQYARKVKRKVVALLQFWMEDASRVQCVDPLRLSFRVHPAAPIEGDQDPSDVIGENHRYVVCLSSSVCTCPMNSVVCKHILALRIFAKLEMNYEGVWMDNELDMIFTAAEMQALLSGGGGALPAAVDVAAEEASPNISPPPEEWKAVDSHLKAIHANYKAMQPGAGYHFAQDDGVMDESTAEAEDGATPLGMLRKLEQQLKAAAETASALRQKVLPPLELTYTHQSLAHKPPRGKYVDNQQSHYKIAVNRGGFAGKRIRHSQPVDDTHVADGVSTSSSPDDSEASPPQAKRARGDDLVALTSVSEDLSQPSNALHVDPLPSSTIRTSSPQAVALGSVGATADASNNLTLVHLPKATLPQKFQPSHKAVAMQVVRNPTGVSSVRSAVASETVIPRSQQATFSSAAKRYNKFCPEPPIEGDTYTKRYMKSVRSTAADT